MTLKRIVTWNSSHEPRLDPRPDFPLKYHCETGGENCDGSYDAGPEDWVGKDDHLKYVSEDNLKTENDMHLSWCNVGKGHCKKNPPNYPHH